MPSDPAAPADGRTGDRTEGRAIDPLIDRLAGGLRPVRRRRPATDAAVLTAVCGVELLLFLLMGGMRPDMHRAMVEPSWWWKLGGMAAVSVVGAGTAVVSLDPSRSPRRGLRASLAVLAACVALGWGLDAARYGLGPLVARLDWRQGVGCVWKMSVLAIPATLALGVLLGRGAPVDRSGTAWAAGLAAAAWGAFVFAFACPSDDPLYVAVWYAAGLGITSVASRLLLGRIARW